MHYTVCNLFASMARAKHKSQLVAQRSQPRSEATRGLDLANCKNFGKLRFVALARINKDDAQIAGLQGSQDPRREGEGNP